MTRPFVELCAGGAALTAHALGGERVATYLGSKRRQAPKLLGLMRVLRPSMVVLNDAGEFGRTLGVMIRDGEQVARVIESWLPENDRELFDRLRAAPPHLLDPVERAAAHLYLQVRTFRSKPVHPTAEGWRTHGFDPEYDPRKGPGANSHARGWATPRPKLAARVRAFAALPWPVATFTTQRDARDITPVERAVVYIDPPYAGTHGYERDLPRADVVSIAQRWADAGCDVYVSEGEPVAELVAQGWTVTTLDERRNQMGRVVEHVTYWRAT